MMVTRLPLAILHCFPSFSITIALPADLKVASMEMDLPDQHLDYSVVDTEKGGDLTG